MRLAGSEIEIATVDIEALGNKEALRHRVTAEVWLPDRAAALIVCAPSDAPEARLLAWRLVEDGFGVALPALRPGASLAERAAVLIGATDFLARSLSHRNLKIVWLGAGELALACAERPEIPALTVDPWGTAPADEILVGLRRLAPRALRTAA